MRQAGILAAAGIYALKHNLDRLVEDHEHASFLAEELANLRGVKVDTDRVQSNIVIVNVGQDTETLRIRAQEKGLLFWPRDSESIRLVTHLGVDQSACKKAVEIFASLLS